MRKNFLTCGLGHPGTFKYRSRGSPFALKWKNILQRLKHVFKSVIHSIVMHCIPAKFIPQSFVKRSNGWHLRCFHFVHLCVRVVRFFFCLPLFDLQKYDHLRLMNTLINSHLILAAAFLIWCKFHSLTTSLVAKMTLGSLQRTEMGVPTSESPAAVP